MAGIGFELKKLFSRRGLFASFRAYGYAGIICTGPMLLGIVLLLGVMFLCDRTGAPKQSRELLVCMITYTLLASLTVTSFLSMVVTRFIAEPFSEREQYTQTLQELENQLLDDNTEIHKTAPASNSANNVPDSTFSDPSYQKIQSLLSDCTPQEMEWILKSVQLIKDCLRDTK